MEKSEESDEEKDKRLAKSKMKSAKLDSDDEACCLVGKWW